MSSISGLRGCSSHPPNRETIKLGHPEMLCSPRFLPLFARNIPMISMCPSFLSLFGLTTTTVTSIITTPIIHQKGVSESRWMCSTRWAGNGSEDSNGGGVGGTSGFLSGVDRNGMELGPRKYMYILYIHIAVFILLCFKRPMHRSG